MTPSDNRGTPSSDHPLSYAASIRPHAPPPGEPANPALSENFHIPFDRIRPEHVVPAVREALAGAEAALEPVRTHDGPRTWENTIAALDELNRRFDRVSTPISHLTSVAETPELREAWNTVLPEISQFWTRVGLDPDVWRAVREFSETEEAAGLGPVERRHIDKTILDFRRSGAELDDARKARLEEVRVELSRLSQRFSENVLDATAAYELLVTDVDRLRGIPDHAVSRYRARAEAKGMEGWLLTLDAPSFEPVSKYAEDRELREELHGAYVGRCRDGEHDNLPVIERSLELRQELAELLGYPDFPDYRLEDTMVKSGARAREFEAGLVERARPYFERDLADLRAHAARLGLDELRPWDVGFVIESLRRERFDVDDEALRPYFPLWRVLEGLFDLVERVFGLIVEAAEIPGVWHRDVRFYEIRDMEGVHLGSFYTDWFPRPEKRQGAWMNAFISGGPRSDGGFDPHSGVVCGNFTPPHDRDVSLLTHREVQTLFHEFGHLLHHCTSRVEVRARGGLNVAWDFVELPSQIMENWCWEWEGLQLFARHHETGDPFPWDLYERLVASRTFMGGWRMMRQLSFGTLDLALHTRWAREEDRASVDTFAEQELLATSAGPEFARSNILTVFSHLFGGGYAAGYYSYLWSEVLEADAFGRFLEAGIFDEETGAAFLQMILSKGDSADPEELFRAFRGRDPDMEALIRRNLGSAA